MSKSGASSEILSPQPEVEREFVTFWLDMHRSEFEPQMSMFLNDLAAQIDVSPASLWVVSIEDGCTKVTLSVERGKRASIEAIITVPKNKLAETHEEIEGDAQSLPLMTFKQQYRVVHVYDPSEKGRAPFISLRVKVQDWHAGRTVTWLHLSDVHTKAKAGSAMFFQDETLGRLSMQLPRLLEFWNLSPDLLFFTGDVAFSGQSAEYRKALTFFEELRKSLPKEPRLFFVPGNHDVDRNAVRDESEQELTKVVNAATSSEAYETVLGNHLIDGRPETAGYPDFGRLGSFFEFVSSAARLGQPPLNHGYFYTSATEVNGVKLRIAGLNSAWRSGFSPNTTGEHTDIGKLAIGHPQMRAALEEGTPKASDVTMALVHHPPESEWYNSFEHPLQRSLLSEFDFVLHGHQHQDHDVNLKHLGKGDDNMTMAAGALYVGGGYPKTFKAVRINLDECLYQVYFWRFVYEKQAWVPDAGPFWPLGYYQSALGTRLRTRHLRARSFYRSSNSTKALNRGGLLIATPRPEAVDTSRLPVKR